jgi:large subunit ribosomal protein L25
MSKDTFELKANLREATGREVEKLRAENFLPAVVYGHGFANQNIVLKNSDFERVFRTAGESSLIDLIVGEEKPIKVLIHDLQNDPITGFPIHVDFYKVNMDEKIKTEVEIVFVNESPAVKDLGGVLIKTLEELYIECLPGDLIHNLEVDLSALKQIGDVIRVADLKIPANILVLTNPENPVVLVEELKLEVFKEETPAVPGAEGAPVPPTEAEAAAAAAGESETGAAPAQEKKEKK